MINFLNSYSSRMHTPDLNTYHDVLFHGTAKRGGKPGYIAAAKPTDSIIEPLMMRRGCEYPAVIKPDFLLAVNEDLAISIGHQFNLRLVETVIERVVNIPLDTVNDRIEEFCSTYRSSPESILDDQPHDESCRLKMGKYFELIAYPEPDLSHPRPPKRQFAVGYTSFDQPDERTISQELLEEVHLISGRGNYVSDKLFAVLEPHLDPRFFYTKSFTP